MLINTFEFKSDNPATKGSRAGVQCLEAATLRGKRTRRDRRGTSENQAGFTAPARNIPAILKKMPKQSGENLRNVCFKSTVFQDDS